MIQLGGEVLYNILIEFRIPMKLVRLIKMCLNEMHSTVRVGKNLSDMFPTRNGLKQGDALWPLLFNFALEYAIRRVQVNQNGLQLNGTHQLLVYADDVNKLGGSVHIIKENSEALVVASKETGIEVNADKTKHSYMVMSRDKNAGRSHTIKINNSCLERVEEFKYLGKTLTNQNSKQEGIKSRLKSGIVCYHSVQNLLTSSFVSKNLKIKTYRTISLLVVLYGSHKFREERRLRVFDNKVLRRIFGPQRDEVTMEWRKLNNEVLNDLYSSPNIVRVIKSRRTILAWQVAHLGERGGVYRVLVGKPEGKRPLGRLRRIQEDIKMDLQELGAWNGSSWLRIGKRSGHV